MKKELLVELLQELRDEKVAFPEIEWVIFAIFKILHGVCIIFISILLLLEKNIANQ